MKLIEITKHFETEVPLLGLSSSRGYQALTGPDRRPVRERLSSYSRVLGPVLMVSYYCLQSQIQPGMPLVILMNHESMNLIFIIDYVPKKLSFAKKSGFFAELGTTCTKILLTLSGACDKISALTFCVILTCFIS